MKARVVEIISETADVKTFVLKPNARFGRFVPGSYVALRLNIDGKPVQRSYSLSSAPSRDGLVRVPVERVAGGLASNWLAEPARRQVLDWANARGQFLLPAQPRRALMTGRSGITQVRRCCANVRKGSTARITFLHFARQLA